MTTLLHLYRARRLRQPPKHIRVLPAVSNEREVGDGGLTWPEVVVYGLLIAAACFISWTHWLGGDLQHNHQPSSQQRSK